MSILQQLSLQLIPVDEETLTLEQNFFFVLRCGKAKVGGLSLTPEEFVDTVTDLVYNSSFACSLRSSAVLSAESSSTNGNETCSSAVCTVIGQPTLALNPEPLVEGKPDDSSREAMMFVDIVFCTVIANAQSVDHPSPSITGKELELSIEHIIPYMVDGIFGTDTDAARFTQHMIEQNRFGGGALSSSSAHRRSVRMPIILAVDPIVITSTYRELNAQSTILSISIENKSAIDTIEISEVFVNIEQSEIDAEKQWEWIVSAQREASSQKQPQSQPYAASVSQRNGSQAQAMLVEDSFDTYSSVDGAVVGGAVTRSSLLFKASNTTTPASGRNPVLFTLTPMHTMTAFTLLPRSGKTLLYRIDGKLSNLEHQVNMLTSFGHFISPLGLYYQPVRGNVTVEEKEKVKAVQLLSEEVEGMIKYDRIYRMQRLRWVMNTNCSSTTAASMVSSSSLSSLLEVQVSIPSYAIKGEDCEVTITIKNHMTDMILMRPQLSFDDNNNGGNKGSNNWVVTPQHVGGLSDILPGESGSVAVKIRSLKAAEPATTTTVKEKGASSSSSRILRLDVMCFIAEMMKVGSNESSKKVVYRQLSPLQIPIVSSAIGYPN